MALASARRCGELDDEGKYVFMAVFSNCCYGGRREKWTAVLTNNKALFEAFHRPHCEHGGNDDYQPYYQGNRLVFRSEEEAEYPWGLCEAYAQPPGQQ